MHDYTASGAHKNKIIGHVCELVESGKKVVVSSTSVKLSQAIVNSIPFGKVIKYYSGQDAKCNSEHQRDGSKSMALIKHEDF